MDILKRVRSLFPKKLPPSKVLKTTADGKGISFEDEAGGGGDGGGTPFTSIEAGSVGDWQAVTLADDGKLFTFATGDCNGLYLPDATVFPAGFRVAVLILDNQAGMAVRAGPGTGTTVGNQDANRETPAFFPASIIGGGNDIEFSPVEKGTLIEVTTFADGPTNEWFITRNFGLGVPNT